MVCTTSQCEVAYKQVFEGYLAQHYNTTFSLRTTIISKPISVDFCVFYYIDLDKFQKAQPLVPKCRLLAECSVQFLSSL